jgi:hypothetical protein
MYRGFTFNNFPYMDEFYKKGLEMYENEFQQPLHAYAVCLSKKRHEQAS